MTGKRWKEDSGVTLLELVIASSVLAIAFVLIMGGLISTSETNAISEDQALASAQAESVIEEIQGLPYEDLLAYQPPNLQTLGANSTLQVVCLDKGGNQVTLPVDVDTFAGPLPNPTQVTVTVQWTDRRGRPFTSSVSTFLRRT